jgi:hypothetical protein
MRYPPCPYVLGYVAKKWSRLNARFSPSSPHWRRRMITPKIIWERHYYIHICKCMHAYIYISVYVECVCICMSFLETRRIFVNKQFLICFSNVSSRATRSFTEFCLRVRGAWPKRRSGHVGFSGFMGHYVGLTLW